MTQDLNAFPGYPLCGFCKDFGITHDEFNGFRFCTCQAGKLRSVNDPKSAEDANVIRQKIGAA